MKKLLAILLAILMVLGLVACGANSASETEAPAADATAAGDSGKEITDFLIGISMQECQAPYYTAMLDIIDSYSKELGITVYVTDSEWDISKQQSDVEDLVAKGIDALIIHPVDSDAMVQLSKYCTSNGVPVFFMDNSGSEGSDYISHITSDARTLGYLAGEWFAKNFKGEAKIGILNGVEGNQVGYKRRSGFLDGVSEYQMAFNNETNFNVVTVGYGGGSQEGGLSAMEDMLMAAPEMNALFVENDAMALGAQIACANAGRDDIWIISVDGQKEAIKQVMDGTNYKVTAINNPQEVSQTAIDTCISYLMGETVPNVVYCEPRIADPDTAASMYNPDAAF